MSPLWLEHQAGIVFFLLLLVLVAATNFRALRRLGRYPPPSRLPRVSILLPARQEEENIIPCIRSLLAQDYPDFEVLALYDDDPADGTGALLQALAEEEPRLRVLRGKPLPPDWLGKHWACQQLAEAATGELLLFTDADTRHHPRALRDAVGALEAEEADLLSAIPREELGSWAERLIVPLMPWSILSFLPLRLAHRCRSPALSAVSGPFMLFKREAYRAIGGHAAVRGDVVDDLALGRRLKAQGLRLRLVDGQERISRRMYRTWRGVFEGFSKNLFAALGYRLIPFVLVWLWLGIVFLQPVIMLARGLAGAPTPLLSWGLAAGAVGFSIFLWGIISWRLGLPRYLPLLYPLSILLGVIIAFRSLALTLAGRTTWKGRRLVRHSLRWF
jgi:chlorobactene glucosyltransferase